MNHNGDNKKGDLVSPALTPQKRSPTPHIVFASVIILILIVVLFTLIKQPPQAEQIEQPSTQQTETITPPEPEPTFNQEFCLNLLRNHVEFGELEFKEDKEAFGGVDIPENIIESAILPGFTTSKIITSNNEDANLFNSCQISSTKETFLELSDTTKFTCDNNIQLFSDESETPDYNYLALVMSIGESVNEIIRYTNPSINTKESFQDSVKKTFNCKETKE